MQYENLIITAPALNASGHSEAEIFGSIVWLAMQAKNKNRLSLQDLSHWLFPALRSQQFILASSCFKSLYHQGGNRGLRVQLFRGDYVSHEQAKRWRKDRPKLARRGTQLEDEVNRTSS
jgi:hemolysin-activating ACP:hemolysin acyltransferase